MSIMPVFFCGARGIKTQGGERAGRGPGRGHRWPEGRSRYMVLGGGGGGQEGERNIGGRDANTHPGKISTGRRKTEQGDAKIRPRDGARRERKVGTAQVPMKDNRGQRSEVRGRSSGRRSPPGARQGQQKTSPAAHRKGEARRSRQREKREKRKGETRYFSPRTPPLSVLHAGGEYLGVVANIITQADEAGFELLGTQRAGVILGPPCASQRAMRCQGGGGREGEGVGHAPVEGSVCGQRQG